MPARIGVDGNTEQAIDGLDISPHAIVAIGHWVMPFGPDRTHVAPCSSALHTIVRLDSADLMHVTALRIVTAQNHMRSFLPH